MKKKSKLQFDELNVLDIYYEPMQIAKSDKARRKELAGLLTDAFLFFFATYEVHQEHQSVLTKQLYQQLLADKVADAVSQVTGIDSYMSSHIKEMSKEVVNTTFKYVDKTPTSQVLTAKDIDATRRINPSLSVSGSYTPPRPLDSPSFSDGLLPNDEPEEKDSSYWLSFKRAEDIAKSEANTFLNYTDYLDAKESGKTKKTWLTMLDDKVRQTHNEVEGQTIGIDEMFTVGDSLMKFPHDLSESPNPSEVIGCRCAVEYK